MAITYPGDAARARAPAAQSRGSFERTYRTARRHSRHVRLLRLGTIAGIAAVVIVLVGANYMPSIGRLRLPGDISKLVINGSKITMQQPKLAGYTTDSRAYEFTADAAAQDINRPDLLELQQLHAKMEMTDQSMVTMTADVGIYDTKTDKLKLNQNIVLISSTGYEGYLSEAVVDMRKGDVASDKPVRVKLLNGFLNAKRLDIVNSGELLRFGGGVAMTLQPGQNAAAQNATGQNASSGGAAKGSEP